MELLVVGTGALACFFAARLASSGCKVTMLGNWQEGIDALCRHGVRLLELDGKTCQYPVEVMKGTDCQGAFEQALVLVKSWQTERTANQLVKCLAINGIALTLQNGLGNYEILEGVLGAGRVALGITTVGVRMLEPGYVQHTGEGKVTIGFHANLGNLDELLRVADFPVEVIDNPKSLLWGKLVINAAINPLTALMRVENGELLARPAAHDILEEVTAEAAQVVEALGINLPYPDPIEAVEEVARKTAKNISSMLQDVLRGTPTEIDAINGAIAQAGEKLGVLTPLNRLLWQLVRGIDGH